MITRLNVASIYVLDKDEALDFYVNKLGLEKGNDVRQGDYRWLTIRVPGERAPRSRSSSRARRCTTKPPRRSCGSSSPRERWAASCSSPTMPARLYETLKERGVTDFTQEPTDHFYGTDMGIRDPFGNPIRILQQGKAAKKATA